MKLKIDYQISNQVAHSHEINYEKNGKLQKKKNLILSIK